MSGNCSEHPASLPQDCGLCIGEQQAPRLHCIFAAACAVVGLPTGPDGPRLHVSTSTETAIYCLRLPVRQTAAGEPTLHQKVPTAAAEPFAVPRGSPLAALRASDAATLQRSHSAPPMADAEGAVQADAMQQDSVPDDTRPRSSGGAAPSPIIASGAAVKLDRSRWRGGAAGSQRQPLRQPETALAVVLTGALVDLLQVPPALGHALRLH